MDVDIDNDFDGKLLDQFRSMGTTDRDVLIAEFQAVLGNKINPESCAFFLDMNNWNLQNAVCSYYDFEQPSSSPSLSMTLLGETTVGEGETVAPNSTFVKTWKIKNSGTERWPPGCHLHFCSGDNHSGIERRMVDTLGPGEAAEVCVEMKSPPVLGSYLSLWRMATATGNYFGDGINIHIVVAEGGLLSLTQQLARIGGTPPTPGMPVIAMEAQQQLQQAVLAFSGTSALQQASSPSHPPPDVTEDTEMS